MIEETLSEEMQLYADSKYPDAWRRKYGEWAIETAQLEAENATLKRDLSDSSAEIVQCHVEIEALRQENAALKREMKYTGKRVVGSRGWLEAGKQGKALGEPVFELQWWLPVLWDDEEDPTFGKLGAIALLTTEEEE